jgi:predicted nucleic acid-binding protein
VEIVPIDARVAHGLERIPRADVPDMPDRIIAATAVSLGVPLVTRDGKIRASTVHTIPA